MPEADDTPDEVVYNARDHLRHDLATPLTTIYARAQFLGRAIRRSASLTEGERGTMLAGIATIEAAVRTLVTRIDVLGDDA